MRLHRFYVNDSVKQQPLGEEIVVDDVSTIKQWVRVFRYKEGDSVILFDGHFKDCTYIIVSLSSKEAHLRLISTKEILPSSRKLTLYISIIKKDNVELVIQKCTELGVSNIVPILAEHSEKKSLNIKRLISIAIEASEQCGRGDIPQITEVMTLKDAFSKRNTSIPHIISDLGGIQHSSLEVKQILSSDEIALWVGPEGGWGPKDSEILTTTNTTRVVFGNNTLRAETASIVLSGVFLLQ